MMARNYVVDCTLSVILIVGVYQFYFLTQRIDPRRMRVFRSPLDEKIPFLPGWSWVYSGLYYPAILYLNWTVESPRDFTNMAFSFIVLLAMQMACFYLYPVATPPHWREINSGKSWSERLLRLVRRFDKESNCFPSMHVSVATLTAMHMQRTLGPAAFAFPVLISLSCLFTKQHYLIDVPGGMLLGWLAYAAYRWVA